MCDKRLWHSCNRFMCNTEGFFSLLKISDNDTEGYGFGSVEDLSIIKYFIYSIPFNSFKRFIVLRLYLMFIYPNWRLIHLRTVAFKRVGYTWKEPPLQSLPMHCDNPPPLHYCNLLLYKWLKLVYIITCILYCCSQIFGLAKYSSSFTLF